MIYKNIVVCIILVLIPSGAFAEFSKKDPYSLIWLSGPHKPMYGLSENSYYQIDVDEFKEIWESQGHTKIIKDELDEELANRYKNRFKNISDNLDWSGYNEAASMILVPLELLGLNFPYLSYAIFGTTLIDKFILREQKIKADTLEMHIAPGGEIWRYLHIKEVGSDNQFELIQESYYHVSVGNENRFFFINSYKALLRCPDSNTEFLDFCVNSCIAINLKLNGENSTIEWELKNDENNKLNGYNVSRMNLSDFLIEKEKIESINISYSISSYRDKDYYFWIEALDKNDQIITVSNMLLLEKGGGGIPVDNGRIKSIIVSE